MARAPSGRQVWGLDVSGSAVKAVCMRMEAERAQIVHAEIIPYEQDASSGDTPGRDRRVWQALQQIETRHRLSRERVAIGLPGPLFFQRPFRIFLLGERSESDLVRFELEQHMPFGLDAVLWDYEMFEPADMSARERDGLLFAMKKDVLSNYLLSLSTAHIEPHLVQSAPLALYNFIRYEIQPDQPMLVMDVGAATTTLLAIVGPRYWLRTVNVGGDSISIAIRNLFKPREISLAEAESIKCRLPELSRRQEIVEQLTPALRLVLGELRTALAHLAKEHQEKFEKVVLLGGSGATYGLAPLISEELRLRPVIPAGLGRIEVAEEADSAFINANLPMLATPIGLALQGLGRSATRVNMVAGALSERRSQTMFKRSAAIVVGAALLLTLIYGTFASARASLIRSGAGAGPDGLGRTLAEPSARMEAARKYLAPGPAEAFISRMESFGPDRAVWLAVLDKVARILPINDAYATRLSDKVWLSNLTVRKREDALDIYEVDMVAGMLLRTDGSNLAYLDRLLKPPLTADTSGAYRVIGDIETARSANFDFQNPGGGQPKYYMVRLRFEVDARKVVRP